MSARAYAWLVLALCAGFLAPVIALNMLLAANNLGVDKNRLASDWQQETRGVTYAPPISQNRPFKTMRLNDRIPEINTIVFGSSTVMGITAEAFPPSLKIYNFAQSSNGLQRVIGEAEYVVEHWGARTKLLIIPLDWALGFVYERADPVRADLSLQGALRDVSATRPSFAAQLVDALSLPRLKILAAIAREVLKAPDKGATFRQIFLDPTVPEHDPAGTEYRCPDGSPARDFDVVYRGICNGFRYDGSATFADQKRLDAARAPAALAMAVSGGGQYADTLRRGRGEPNPVFLERIAQLARHAEAKGARIILLLPPLMPGMEESLGKSVHSGTWLRVTKDVIEKWAGHEQIQLLDAGRSERYGCVATEFIDPHHALPECYARVVSRFFADHPQLLRSGATANR